MASVVARRTEKSTAAILQNLAQQAAGRSHDASGKRVLLLNLPRTALPSDVRKLCARGQLDCVSNIALDYYRFSPTGRAWVTVTDPPYGSVAVKALDKCVVGGSMIAAHVADPPLDRPGRTRGLKGRMEAAERGIVNGTGPDGSVAHQGRCVMMCGMPGKMTPEGLQEFLKSYKLAGSEGGQREAVKIDVRGAERFALTSRHFVRLASVSEAHRLVRNLHMTFYNPDLYGTRYQIHAHVIY